MNLPLKVTDSVFVDGEWVKAAGSPEPVINPATEEIIGHAPVGNRAQVDAAIAAAREAFDKGPWPRMKPAERAAKLRELHAALMERRSDIQSLLTIEAGAIASLMPLQFDFPMMLALNAVEEGGRDRDQPMPIGVAPNPTGGKNFVTGVVRREAVGVVAAITPYNFPFFLNIMKLFPALVTGNTVVLKPSPYTPFAALIVADTAARLGFPRGVVNLVTGGKDVGEMLTTDPRVDLITFTGSDAVGSAIMAQAAPSLKRLHFELGGKSALIIREDADLQAAVEAGMGYMSHCGQGCATLTRNLVHNSIRKQYVEMLKARHDHLKIGDPADASVNLGPLIREAARARTEMYVEEGLKSGATLVTGGRRPPQLGKGFFYEPTVFDNVDNRSRLAQEEVFGPILSIVGYDTDEEAVALANDSVFGLGGGIYSRDLGAAYEMACAIRTGTLNINGGGYAPGSTPPPFGGYKRSGFGREWGAEGLNAFTELKAIAIRQI